MKKNNFRSRLQDFSAVLFGLALISLILSGCGAMFQPPNAYFSEGAQIKHVPVGPQQTGMASWYGEPFHGRLTASGETFDMYEYTAAHRTLPFGSVVRVVNRLNNRGVVVRINDRGPFKDDRIIDLSFEAAKACGMIFDGVVPVIIEVIYNPETDS